MVVANFNVQNIVSFISPFDSETEIEAEVESDFNSLSTVEDTSNNSVLEVLEKVKGSRERTNNYLERARENSKARREEKLDKDTVISKLSQLREIRDARQKETIEVTAETIVEPVATIASTSTSSKETKKLSRKERKRNRKNKRNS